MRPRHQAVTVVELLIVVGLIAILAALVIPVVNGISQRGKAAGCLTKMRSLSLLLFQYANDNSRAGYLPYGYDVSDPQRAVPWAERLQGNGLLPATALDWSQSVDASPLFCPGSSTRWNGYNDWLRGHYALNLNLAGGDGFTPTSLRSLENPNRVVMLLDGGAYVLAWSHVSAPHQAIWFLPGDPRNSGVEWSHYNEADALTGRHGGRLNVCFADGHIESLTAAEISKDPTNWIPSFQ